MLRSTLSALAFAGLLAAAHPVLADPVADHAQAEASATGQEVAPPASVERLNDVPVGFGWG